jgi:hypothetical protein
MPKWYTIATIVSLTLACATTSQAQPRQRGFSVVLLVGDVQPGPGTDNVPTAVRKALTDVKDFLPFKSYRVLETQWVPGSNGGSIRLHGLDDQEYEVQITADEALAGPRQGVLSVLFKLQEPGAPSTAGEELPRSMAHDAQVQELEERLTGLKKRLAVLRAKKLIESKFEMAVGETVVVGTSRIGGGNKGLIVLLTAVAPAGK